MQYFLLFSVKGIADYLIYLSHIQLVYTKSANNSECCDIVDSKWHWDDRKKNKMKSVSYCVTSVVTSVEETHSVLYGMDSNWFHISLSLQM